MKKILIFTLFALLTVSLASCGAEAVTTSTLDMYVSTYLPTDYESALSVRNQLALGTLNLAGTALAPTSSEAQTLITLWQALLFQFGFQDSQCGPQGFSAGSAQFDSDITSGRHPRSAIGVDAVAKALARASLRRPGRRGSRGRPGAQAVAHAPAPTAPAAGWRRTRSRPGCGRASRRWSCPMRRT